MAPFDRIASLVTQARAEMDGLRAALDAASTVEAACAAFEAVLPPLGYHSVDYASGPIVRWPMRGNLDWAPDVIYATYDWAEVYFGTDFQKHDRMLPYMMKQVGPWLYWDVWSVPPEDPVAFELEARARTKIASGISIPFHGPGLRFAAANLGSNLSREALEARDRETRADAFLAASLLHARIQALTEGAPPLPALTARESDALTWAARGKTAWETGAILDLSESTVKKHLLSAGRKLGASTGAHAVAIALSRGMILP